MLIQKKEPIFDERYSDFSKSFARSAFAILPATFIFIYNAFVTLFKHNFTNFSTYLEAYINGLQIVCLFSLDFFLKWCHSWFSKVVKYAFLKKLQIQYFLNIKIYEAIVILNWISFLWSPNLNLIIIYEFKKGNLVHSSAV